MSSKWPSPGKRSGTRSAGKMRYNSVPGTIIFRVKGTRLSFIKRQKRRKFFAIPEIIFYFWAYEFIPTLGNYIIPGLVL